MSYSVLESKLPANFEVFTDRVIDRGWVGAAEKNKRPIAGGVSPAEAHTLASIILQHDCKKSLETGVANGIRTLAITQAIAHNNGHHHGIDPCQLTDHHGVALTLLEEHNLLSRFTLHEGPTHLEAPKLLDTSEKFDFIFIDGMHKFDYKFIDFFYGDKLLEVGGFLVFHDLLLPSVKKLSRLIQKSYSYEIFQTDYQQPSFTRKAKYTIAALLKGKPYWYSWQNGFRNLLVLRKTAETEHPWNYFVNF
jgi:predicted O-methyltransferase YrrM